MTMWETLRRTLLPWPDTAADAPAIKALSDATVPRERSRVLNWAWQDQLGGAITLPGPHTQAYADIYARQLWARVVVDKLAGDIGRLPLKAYGTNADTGDRFRLRDAPLARLLARPYARWSPSRWKGQIVADLATFGNALVIKGARRPDRAPDWLLPASPVNFHLDDAGDYVFRDGGEERTIPAWRVVHFFFPNPKWGDRGVAKFESLREALANDYAARKFANSVFENHAQPSGGLSTDQELSQEAIDRLRAQFDARHTGIGAAGRPVVLAGGLKWQAFSYNVNDSAVIDHRKLSREEVCSVFDVPPPVVGILDRATFSNIEEQHLMYYMDTLGKWLVLIEETLAIQLIEPVDDFRGNFVEFDLNEVLKGNIQQRYDAINKAVGGAWMTVNEARRLENLPLISRDVQPDASRVLFPLNMGTAPGSAEPAPGGKALKEVIVNGH